MTLSVRVTNECPMCVSVHLLARAIWFVPQHRSAYGTAKSGVGVAAMGVMRPELVMKSIVPVVMAGILGIYGLIIAVIISTGINPTSKPYYFFDGYAHLASGLSCGLAGLGAGT